MLINSELCVQVVLRDRLRHELRLRDEAPGPIVVRVPASPVYDRPAVPLVAQVFALIAALLHVSFFYVESIAFTRPASWKRFGVASQEAADTIRPMAFNQGFYNLFLAGGVVLGLALIAANWVAEGRAIVLFACACMALAGVVLLATDRAFVRAATLQAGPPLIAIVATLLLK
jgi:putative membrane protein